MTTRLEPGAPAPQFTATSASGDTVSLSDFSGRKVIVYFYPAAGTPGCTTQACDFRDSLASLQGAGYTVLGISPDSADKLATFTNNESLSFPLLADPDKEIASAYGAYGEKKNYGKTVMGIIRSTFVLNEDHTIDKALYNVKATGHVARLRKELGLDN
ncbi:thioredoxin-dependent thiol peroxidase [Jonesia quinghaiensis]|uniref:thioredoxin-dependent thiol peroxidase n=1 Tax=Jonesia quinghaiensis TaxID=262806 RepID=UPI0004917461|nr:thioredoxin-dependent thiol peroxidase [Jonesia quinghaiensis]